MLICWNELIADDLDATSNSEVKKIGQKTQGWLGKAAKSAATSGLKVTEVVASKVIEGIIKGYLTIP